jgi:hypothetical protein
MMVACRIADAQGWVLGETLERAVKALDNEIAAREKPERVSGPMTQHIAEGAGRG